MKSILRFVLFKWPFKMPNRWSYNEPDAVIMNARCTIFAYAVAAFTMSITIRRIVPLIVNLMILTIPIVIPTVFMILLFLLKHRTLKLLSEIKWLTTFYSIEKQADSSEMDNIVKNLIDKVQSLLHNHGVVNKNQKPYKYVSQVPPSECLNHRLNQTCNIDLLVMSKCQLVELYHFLVLGTIIDNVSPKSILKCLYCAIHVIEQAASELAILRIKQAFPSPLLIPKFSRNSSHLARLVVRAQIKSFKAYKKALELPLDRIDTDKINNFHSSLVEAFSACSAITPSLKEHDVSPKEPCVFLKIKDSFETSIDDRMISSQNEECHVQIRDDVFVSNQCDSIVDSNVPITPPLINKAIDVEAKEEHKRSYKVVMDELNSALDKTDWEERENAILKEKFNLRLNDFDNSIVCNEGTSEIRTVEDISDFQRMALLTSELKNVLALRKKQLPLSALSEE
ncbi:hypothetical protein ACOME3_010190 [Neoechinorhynchus agilis]